MAVCKIAMDYPESFSVRNKVISHENENEFNIYRLGNVIHFSFRGEEKARAENDTIFTVNSSDIMPKNASFYAGFIGLITPCLFRLYGDGKMIIYSASSYPKGRAYVSGSWVI